MTRFIPYKCEFFSHFNRGRFLFGTFKGKEKMTSKITFYSDLTRTLILSILLYIKMSSCFLRRNRDAPGPKKLFQSFPWVSKTGAGGCWNRQRSGWEARRHSSDNCQWRLNGHRSTWNCLAGIIHANLDHLLRNPRFTIVWELNYHVRYCLVALPGKHLTYISVVCSHGHCFTVVRTSGHFNWAIIRLQASTWMMPQQYSWRRHSPAPDTVDF